MLWYDLCNITCISHFRHFPVSLMDPVSAIILLSTIIEICLLGFLVVGLVALFAECFVIICRSCYHSRSSFIVWRLCNYSHGSPSRVFHSIVRTSGECCYKPVSISNVHLGKVCEYSCRLWLTSVKLIAALFVLRSLKSILMISLYVFFISVRYSAYLLVSMFFINNALISGFSIVLWYSISSCNSLCPLCKHDMFVYSLHSTQSSETVISVISS